MNYSKWKDILPPYCLNQICLLKVVCFCLTLITPLVSSNNINLLDRGYDSSAFLFCHWSWNFHVNGHTSKLITTFFQMFMRNIKLLVWYVWLNIMKRELLRQQILVMCGFDTLLLVIREQYHTGEELMWGFSSEIFKKIYVWFWNNNTGWICIRFWHIV